MPVPLVRLFPLDLLKSFVAVGRRMSITLAADDLCLTQSAVSRQILALEERLGVKLFVRKHRSIAFTDEGERLFRSADAVVQQLQDVVAEIRRVDGRQPVTVSASIGVTGLWLLPRLGGLQQRYPELDVRLSASNRFVDLRADGIDLAIRHCRAAAAPADAIRLFDETIAPVAHASLRAGPGWPAEVLTRLPLLEFEDPRPWFQWRNWLDGRGWRQASKRGVPRHATLRRRALWRRGVLCGSVSASRCDR